jgi:predicted deacylase
MPIRAAWVVTPPGLASSSPVPRGALFLALAAAGAIAGAPSFRAMHRSDPIVAGAGVTARTQLSAWLPSLAGGPGDTPVFILAGHEPGGTALVLGGTHGDEAAGYVAAVVLVERAVVRAGRLLVVPRANNSGFTHNIGQEAHPSSFAVATPGGPRRFTFGARATNPVHQWPDPQIYTHRDSGQTLSGSETRNLNRAYPGRRDGSLTERVAFAITTLIRHEGVTIAIDLHEASPEYPVVNTIVAHEAAMDVAALANMNLQARNIDIGLEASPATLRGLSHREWGDASGALALLVETTSPAQGRLRGRTDAALVVEGRDRFYVHAADRHRLTVPFPSRGWPLTIRVARHLATVAELLRVAGDLQPAAAVVIERIPEYDSVVREGIGVFLHASTAADGGDR